MSHLLWVGGGLIGAAAGAIGGFYAGQAAGIAASRLIARRALAAT